MCFDDGSHAHAICMSGNRLRVHGVRARGALRVEFLVDDADAVDEAPSLTARLLQRIGS